jgi:hypothetical protein
MNTKTTVALTFTALFLAGSTVRAQTAEPAKTFYNSLQIQAGISFLSPLGKADERYEGGNGAILQVDIPMSEVLKLTLNGGYEVIKKEDSEVVNVDFGDLKHVPLNLGLRYAFYKKFYASGEAGISLLTNKKDFKNGKVAAFTYAPQVGYLFTIGKQSIIDAGIRFEGIGKHYESGYATNFFGLRVSYNYNIYNN